MDWGLGHAARDVPIIQALLDRGCEVQIAGCGASMDLLKSEFPELESHVFRSFPNIRYSLHFPAWLKITLLSPALLWEVLAEHYRLKRLVRTVGPDVVISDNRYGLWNRRVYCVLITHQLSIRPPGFARFLEFPVRIMIRVLISKFDRCWIPDFPGTENLSGDLSHGCRLPRNAVFIGAVSRFAGHTSGSGDPKVDLLVILSGPEPVRGRLQKIVLAQALSIDVRCVILQGLPGKFKRVDLTSLATMYSHLTAGKMKRLLLSSENIICNAGYTGIMDLALTGKKAMLVPTPGQTEQEYLAHRLSERGYFLMCKMHELELDRAIDELEEFTPAFDLPEDGLFEKELEGIAGRH
jgi:UDP:flavonoid glycosyltransferase YjiC (YdhE family)